MDTEIYNTSYGVFKGKSTAMGGEIVEVLIDISDSVTDAYSAFKKGRKFVVNRCYYIKNSGQWEFDFGPEHWDKQSFEEAEKMFLSYFEAFEEECDGKVETHFGTFTSEDEAVVSEICRFIHKGRQIKEAYDFSRQSLEEVKQQAIENIDKFFLSPESWTEERFKEAQQAVKNSASWWIDIEE